MCTYSKIGARWLSGAILDGAKIHTLTLLSEQEQEQQQEQQQNRN
jgi:hypothetical protein